jgi:type IV pilus assembly protein PilC
MLLKSVILPFKYFSLGVFIVFERIIHYFLIMIKYFAKLIEIIGVNLYLIIRKIVIVLFQSIKTIIVLLYKGLKYVLLYLFKGGQTVIIYTYKIIALIIIQISKYIFLIFKNIYCGLVLILQKIYYVLKQVVLLIINIIKFIVGQVINLLKLISKIPLYFWLAIKFISIGVYKIFIYPFVFIYSFIKKLIVSVWDLIENIIDKTKDWIKSLAQLPQKIKKGLIDWYGNLSFVRDRRNRMEMKRQTLLIDFEGSDEVRSEEKIMYRYTGKNSDGKIEKGKLSAYSKLDVHSYLLAEGYEIYEIETFKGLNFGKKGYNKVKTSELVFLLTQLSTYIKAGIPLVDAIKILGKQNKKKEKKDLYRSIVYELTMGESFSEALAKQGKAFPRLLVNMIKSAELAGNLPETLDSMADYYTVIHKTRKQMISAMTYPTVIFIFAITVITFIMIFVIPEFVEMYKDMGGGLPVITRFTITISDYLQRNILYLILGLIAAIGGSIAIYSNVKMFKTLIQWLLMHLPVVGKIIIYNEVTMFAKTFASLLNHNVFITDSMEILSKITNNEIYKMLIFDTITNIARGESISNSFKNHWAFPIVAYEMLLTGERTGQPGSMMDKVADYYQEEHRTAVNQVKTFIEPVMIVFITVIVGFILLSVILPMFELYGQLG